MMAPPRKRLANLLLLKETCKWPPLERKQALKPRPLKVKPSPIIEKPRAVTL